PRSRGAARLQGARAQLPARRAPSRGAPRAGTRVATAAPTAPRDRAGVPRPPATRRRARPPDVRALGRRVRRGRRRGGAAVKLHRLRLVNFRQHADTEIVFGDGITGIIGPNGSGKTSLLEGLAWAIYGNAAARGDKESIRNLRAKARAQVLVELEFSLGTHAY